MFINGDYDIINSKFHITISLNIAKLTSIVNITNPNYKADFTASKSFASLLGFNK